MNEEEKNNFNQTANQVKDEFKESAKDVSETFKNVNIKEDSVATGHFVKDMIFHPIEKVKEVANSEDGNYLKYAIIIIALYCIAGFMGTLDTLFKSYYTLGGKISNIISSTVAPLLTVLIPAIVIMFVPGGNKKSLMKILLPLVTICFVPSVAAKYLTIIPFVDSIRLLSIPLSAIRGVLYDFSVVLCFVAITELYKNDTDGNKSFVKYALVFGIAAIIQSIILIFI